MRVEDISLGTIKKYTVHMDYCIIERFVEKYNLNVLLDDL